MTARVIPIEVVPLDCDRTVGLEHPLQDRCFSFANLELARSTNTRSRKVLATSWLWRDGSKPCAMARLAGAAAFRLRHPPRYLDAVGRPMGLSKKHRSRCGTAESCRSIQEARWLFSKQSDEREAFELQSMPPSRHLNRARCRLSGPERMHPDVPLTKKSVRLLTVNRVGAFVLGQELEKKEDYFFRIVSNNKEVLYLEYFSFYKTVGMRNIPSASYQSRKPYFVGHVIGCMSNIA